MGRYAIVENGVVANIVVAEAAFAKKQGWVKANEAEIGDAYANGVFSTLSALPPVPRAVTPLQMRCALRTANLKAAVAAFLAGAGEEAQEAWEYAIEIRRDHALVAAAAASAKMSADDLDNLFRLAATMTA